MPDEDWSMREPSSQHRSASTVDVPDGYGSFGPGTGREQACPPPSAKEASGPSETVGISPKIKAAIKGYLYDPPLPEIFRVEGNLIEYPLCGFQRRSKREKVKFKKKRQGKIFEASTEHGTLDGSDYALLIRAFGFIRKLPKGNVALIFSNRTMASLMGYSTKDGSYSRRLNKQLKKIRTLRITADNTFLMKTKGGSEYPILKDYPVFVFFATYPRKRKKFKVLLLNECLSSNILNKYHINILRKDLKCLGGNYLAIRLFCYLVKKIGKRGKYSERVASIRRKMVLRDKDKRRAESKIKTAIELLRNKELIEGCNFYPLKDKSLCVTVQKEKEDIKYDGQGGEYPLPNVEVNLEEAEGYIKSLPQPKDVLATMLIMVGVVVKTAKDIAGKYPTGILKTFIRNAFHKKAKNLPGYIVGSLTNYSKRNKTLKGPYELGESIKDADKRWIERYGKPIRSRGERELEKRASSHVSALRNQ